MFVLALSLLAANSCPLIATGHDNPNPAQFAKYLAPMTNTPFDGVVIEVDASSAPKEVGILPFRSAFSSAPWSKAWFESAIKTLSEAKPRKLRTNFVRVNANPGTVDWDDDAAWRQVADHFRIAAMLAKRSGLKGIAFDPEPYTTPKDRTAQFKTPNVFDHVSHDFAYLERKARLRGMMIGRAVREQYPDITIFAYFLHSTFLRNGSPTRNRLANNYYGLLPAFMDGWMEQMGSSAQMIDGCEDSYRFNALDQFQRYADAKKKKGGLRTLVDPDERGRYDRQVEVGFGLYMDAYVNPEGSTWFIDGMGGPRVERLGANLRSAREAGAALVWVYGEKGTWWPPAGDSKAYDRRSFPTWESLLPGATHALSGDKP